MLISQYLSEGAQCFHWSHPDYSSSVEEFARILKPEGTLGLIWNLEDRNAAGWISQIRGAYEKYEQNTPQFRNYWWKAMFETSAYKACVIARITTVKCENKY